MSPAFDQQMKLCQTVCDGKPFTRIWLGSLISMHLGLVWFTVCTENRKK